MIPEFFALTYKPCCVEPPSVTLPLQLLFLGRVLKHPPVPDVDVLEDDVLPADM